MLDCLERLITTLTSMGMRIHDRDGILLFSREQNVRGVMFWDADGLWHVGYPSTTDGTPTATLSTPHQDVALRWLICRIANRYREKQKWRYLLPLRNIPGFANGWTAEQTSEQTITTTIKATGRLIRPDGTPDAMDMSTAFPHAPELAALSHLMHLTPDQVLDAYLTPDGGPLNHLLEHGDPVTNQGTDFKHLVSACAKHVTTYTDGFTIDWSNHFWLEDGCWHYGTTERSESRSEDISSPHQDLVLRWAAFETLNIFRRRKKWPLLFTSPLPKIAMGWTVKETHNRTRGTLVSPEGTVLEMVLKALMSSPWKLNVYSHLAPSTPEQIIDNFLLEDGGSFRNYLATPPSS